MRLAASGLSALTAALIAGWATGGWPPQRRLRALPRQRDLWLQQTGVGISRGQYVMLTLGTVLVAFLLVWSVSGLMAVAYFAVHAPRGFYPILNQGELAILYCFVFLYIAAAGSGPWSLDAMRRK